MKLGGVAVWAIENDDFSGSYCKQGMYPLLNALNDELLIVKEKFESSHVPVTTSTQAAETNEKPVKPSKKALSILNSLSR